MEKKAAVVLFLLFAGCTRAEWRAIGQGLGAAQQESQRQMSPAKQTNCQTYELGGVLHTDCE